MSNENNNNSMDPMILCKSARHGENKSGNLYVATNFSPEEADKLVEAIQNSIHDERGLQLMVNFSPRKAQNGEEFLGAVMFVREVPEYKGDNNNKGPRRGAAPSRAASGSRDRLSSLRSGRGNR
jgi:hypothetical protein